MQKDFNLFFLIFRIKLQYQTVEPVTSFKNSDSDFNDLAHSVLKQLFDKSVVSFEAISTTSVGTKAISEKIQKILDPKYDDFLHDNILQDSLGCKQFFSALAQNQ